MRRIYSEYLKGKGANRIAKDLKKEEISKWDGTFKWYESSIRKMPTFLFLSMQENNYIKLKYSVVGVIKFNTRILRSVEYA